MALHLGRRIVELLKSHPEQKFTARDIAQWVLKAYPEQCAEKKARSPRLRTDEDLQQQLVAEIGSQFPRLRSRDLTLKSTEGRPRKYYYTQQSDVAEVMQAEGTAVPVAFDNSQEKLLEHDLYPVLSQYLWSELRVYSKRIDEKRSANRRGPNGNRWLYPDLVGMEDLGQDWHREVRDCVQQYSDTRTKLWSFEVKLLINRSNVRECFFQTVSNSSWANFGYLVAKEIDHTAMKELRMLVSAHGIGVIQLNAENPPESQILIPAREKDPIDWDMVNRLADENRDFLNYIKVIKQFYQTGEARFADWDTVELEDD